MGGQGNCFLSSHFFREYWFNQQACCQPTSNQIVLMPKICQSQGRWLVRNGLQEWKRTAGRFHWFGKAQSWFRNCSRREAQAALGEEDRSEALPSTLPDALGHHGRAAPQHRGPKCGIISLVPHTKGAKGRPLCHLSNSGKVDLAWSISQRTISWESIVSVGESHYRWQYGQLSGSTGGGNSSYLQSWSDCDECREALEKMSSIVCSRWNQQHLIGQDIGLSEMELFFEVPWQL